MRTFRGAIIGCGGRARAHLRYLAAREDAEVTAVCDPVEAARNKAGDEYGVAHRYATIEEMLDAEALDGVFINTPPHLNGIAALPCLKRGVNALIEKPPGMTVEETTELRDAAAESGAKAQVGWNRRFHKIIVDAKEIVAERGPTTQLVAEFHKSMTGLVNHGKLAEVVLDNMLLETTIHAIDTMRFLAGADVAEVHAITRRAASKYKDVYAGLVLFENGVVGQLISNYTTDARLERYEIHGCDVSAYLEGVSKAVIVRDGKRQELTEGGSGGLVEQNDHFVECVLNDRPIESPAPNLDEAVKSMELAYAILDGLRD